MRTETLPVPTVDGFPTASSSFDVLAQQIHQTAVDHGWWEQERNVGEVLMLMVSELSEAFEHYRNNKGLAEIFYKEGGAPDGVAVELADVLIRLLDFTYHNNIPIMNAMIEKMRYNETRPYRHGGKRC